MWKSMKIFVTQNVNFSILWLSFANTFCCHFYLKIPLCPEFCLFLHIRFKKENFVLKKLFKNWNEKNKNEKIKLAQVRRNSILLFANDLFYCSFEYLLNRHYWNWNLFSSLSNPSKYEKYNFNSVFLWHFH